ncbi:MAG: hypothetical protein LBN33_09370 [Desulfovibrio sp.]|jgi:FtsH-binding integral membrane protein|nr:hypothetical protein [Desulfovibrio sp.]
MLTEILESAMLLAFGAAWPAALLNLLRSRTAKGTSLPFLIIVLAGYICGIGAKVAADTLNYVLAFYILNFVMVSGAVVLYFRNRKLDQKRAGRAD